MTDGTNSEASSLTEHYLKLWPMLQNTKAAVFNQASHPNGFKRHSMGADVQMAEAFEGAFAVIGDLNPDLYQMPHGTRVVNIKTDFLENIQYSVRIGKWSTLQRVSERIMNMWNAREAPEERLVFLFAVNGTKQFCGVAEMTGEWDPSDTIDGWKVDPNKPCVGSIPVTWVYVKNVSYAKFRGITQERNNQPVINMWNGMHFDWDAGRKVMEIYVSTPHFSNMLSWPKKKENADAQSTQPNGSTGHGARALPAARNGRGGHINQSTRGVDNTRGPETTKRPDSAMALKSDNWRLPQTKTSPTQPTTSSSAARGNNNLTTAVPPRLPNLTVNTNMPPPPHFDGAASSVGSTPRPGQLVTCVIDDNGNFVPVSTSPSIKGASPRTAVQPQQPFDAFGPRESQKIGLGLGNYHGGMHGVIGSGRLGASSAHPKNAPTMWAGPAGVPPTGVNLQHELRHETSADTIKAHTAPLSPEKPERPLRHTTSNAYFVPQAQQNNATSPLRHMASAAAFAQPPPKFEPLTARAVPPAPSSNYTFMSEHGSMQRQVGNVPSNQSNTSFMRSADSQAGYDSRYKPPQIRQTVQETPTHVSHSTVPRTILEPDEESWARKTPPLGSMYPTPVDGAIIPLNKKTEYFRLMYEMSEIELKIRDTSDRDSGEYFHLIGDHRDLEKRLKDLLSPSNSYSDRSAHTHRTRGSSEADDSIVSTSSIEKHNISPVRTREGRALHSASKRGSPISKCSSPVRHITRHGRRAANAPFSATFDAKVKACTARSIGSQPSSVHGATSQISPSVTNPFSDRDDHDHDNGPGGIELPHY